ncbi:Hypothetical_protein [Hexamita inflata]|uniref:Hypothetical_protein n=1 Tax=Hexamita inflata TaxID=28002 RepID=A0AA86QV13_9EUKA|nr:Hypothetical protein HINF_LOCUS48916 [Hexamita inflata]CAI9961277.1 Hypothetical protein HINF_LOCUS48922 [Hexamita inflata]
MFENHLNETKPQFSSLPVRTGYNELKMLKYVQCTGEKVENQAKRKQEFEIIQANNQINEAVNRKIKINLYNTLVNTVQTQQVDCALIDNNVNSGNNSNKIILAPQQNQNISNSFNTNISIKISNISIQNNSVDTMDNEERLHEFTNSNKMIKQMISVLKTLEGFCEYFSNLVDQKYLQLKFNSNIVESFKIYMKALEYLSTAFDITIAQGQILYQKHAHSLLSLETQQQIKSYAKITEQQ